MFERLQKKWKVTGLQLALIVITFALGGSITGYIGKKIITLLAIQQDWLWTIVYILLIILLWPLAVVIVSIPFGQFPFFIKYIRKIGSRMGIVRSSESGPDSYRVESQESGVKTHLAIFASGAGSNAQKIIDHFRGHLSVRVMLIACNNPQAGVLKIAATENIPSLLLEKERFFHEDGYVKELEEKKIDFIVLAGFLWKLPGSLTSVYKSKIINIHPALLPRYGGHGMYGHFVHEAVIAAKEKESGITIHDVDEIYDHGQIIFQAQCPVFSTDTANLLAQRIHTLEHEHYPLIIEKWIQDHPSTR